MRIVLQGYRVLFVRSARAHDLGKTLRQKTKDRSWEENGRPMFVEFDCLGFDDQRKAG